MNATMPDLMSIVNYIMPACMHGVACFQHANISAVFVLYQMLSVSSASFTLSPSITEYHHNSKYNKQITQYLDKHFGASYNTYTKQLESDTK